jgi:peptidylprolyl isomerase
MYRRLTPLLLALALLGAACGGSTSVTSDFTTEDASTTTTSIAESASSTAPVVDAINGGKPVVEIPAGDVPTDLESDDLIDGTGKTAASGDYLLMHYVGVLHDNGEQFDASWDRGDTFNFILGQGRVIQGWDEGIVGMKVGGRRLLNIPPEQAYGDTDRSGIPANSGLVFVVDLLGAFTPPEVENASEPVTELQVTVVEDGTGDPVEAGSLVEIHYRAVLQTTGEVFASSWEDGQPAIFEVGVTPMQTIPAWDVGLQGKRVGDSIRMVIPPGLGISGASDQIPADATIITEVTILGVTG